MGGLKGYGTNYYLARLIDFIYRELDNGSNKDRKAVAAMAIDLSKAFNRLDHGKLVTLLFDMGVPPCPLKLLISYLSGRTMEVHLDDAGRFTYRAFVQY